MQNESVGWSEVEIEATDRLVQTIVEGFKDGAVSLGLSTQMLRHLLALFERGDRARLMALAASGQLPAFPFLAPMQEGVSAQFQGMLQGFKTGLLSWADVRSRFRGCVLAIDAVVDVDSKTRVRMSSKRR